MFATPRLPLSRESFLEITAGKPGGIAWTVIIAVNKRILSLYYRFHGVISVTGGKIGHFGIQIAENLPLIKTAGGHRRYNMDESELKCDFFTASLRSQKHAAVTYMSIQKNSTYERCYER